MIDLVGTWRLVSCVRRSGDRVEHPFGEQPVGLLLYTEDGWMSVQLMAGDRTQLPSPDPAGRRDADAALAFSTYLGYCGRYRTSRDTVVHQVEVCSIPNWVGTEQVRPVSTSGEALVLRTPEAVTAEGPAVGNFTGDDDLPEVRFAAEGSALVLARDQGIDDQGAIEEFAADGADEGMGLN